MPQENLNKIWNAGKLFEPKPEQDLKPTPDETKPSNVKRRINVAKAFVPQQEDPFKKKVEAVLKGMEPASADLGFGEAKEKLIPSDAEVIVGTRQNKIGEHLVAGKSIQVKGNAGYRAGDYMSGGIIYVEGDAEGMTGESMSGGEIHVRGKAGDWTAQSMSGGEIHIKGGAGKWTGDSMSNGTLRIDSDVASFDRSAFIPNNKGTIIWKGEIIWKNGKKVEPGWTNLNVKEKIAY